LTAAPRLCESVSWVGMPSPVDPLRECDARDECDAYDDPHSRSATVLLLRTLAQLWARWCKRDMTGLLVRRRFSFCPSFDQAGLHLPDQIGIVGQRLRNLCLQSTFAGEVVRKLLQFVRRLLDLLISRRHFFLGGSSPVSVRQIRVAVRRETIVATAASPP
jgi:hypothetical protein